MSVVRIGLIGGVIGIVLLLVGVFSFIADQQSRRMPLDVEPFPGAEVWGYGDTRSNQRTLFYRAPGVDPVTVASYYQQRMGSFYGDNAEHCVRNPSVGDNPIPPNEPNAIPYEYRCMFDRSGMGTSQYTLVKIYPGLASNDPDYNSVGSAVIVYEQVWQG